MDGLHEASILDPEMSALLIDSAGKAGFAQLLLDTARKLDSIEEVFAYRLPNEKAPEPLLSSSGLDNVAQRTSLYSRRFYRFDPATPARLTTGARQRFTVLVRASQITRADYRAICFEHPRFEEKLCFGWRGRDQSFVLNFYRRRASGRTGTQSLSELAGLALAALIRQDRHSGDRLALVERLELRFMRCFPELSVRERQICARTLAGWTAQQIGLRLSIRPGTVLTYRQRAYQRLGFSTANEFLDELLD